uniref:Synergin gamma C-terminal domain-containing protein n=1 Tax=Parastrongyloides trichosuri TaxID=131310 RepID=A0A0N4Z250_PARTI
MLTSQLPIEILKEILYFVNKVTPEKLTRQEFYSCLALIALAQKKQTISDLSSATQLPIPFLQTYQAVTSMGSIEMENKNIKDHILRKPKTNDSNIININMPFFNNSHSSSSNNLSNNILINKEHYENIILYNWIKIIDKSVDIIDNANCILTKSISLSSDVSRTKKGIMFIASLYAIHQVVKRIAASVNILGENGSKLLSKIQTFGEIWANLLELTFFNEAIEKNTSDQRKYDFKKENINCCLCLRSITSCIISFNNFSYHSECGNFWINFISSPLPNHYIQM